MQKGFVRRWPPLRANANRPLQHAETGYSVRSRRIRIGSLPRTRFNGHRQRWFFVPRPVDPNVNSTSAEDETSSSKRPCVRNLRAGQDLIALV